MIDIIALQEAYEQRTVSDVVWIEGKSNPADAITKTNHNQALTSLLDNNRIDIDALKWVDRS